MTLYSSDDLVKRLRTMDGDRMSIKTIDEAADRVEELQAKLAKVVEALGVIDALDPEGMIDGCSQLALRGLVLRMGEHARAALAELKGEKDD